MQNGDSRDALDKVVVLNSCNLNLLNYKTSRDTNCEVEPIMKETLMIHFFSSSILHVLSVFVIFKAIINLNKEGVASLWCHSTVLVIGVILNVFLWAYYYFVLRKNQKVITNKQTLTFILFNLLSYCLWVFGIFLMTKALSPLMPTDNKQ